ncbi:MAG: hypothetical protein E6K65_05605 [Nitrospirae bacterium]|nr:MAG: hypothetical protein E6K65_05605 [Nitrospirota bacterium]
MIYSSHVISVGVTRSGVYGGTYGSKAAGQYRQGSSRPDEALIAKLNEAVSRGQLKNKASKPVTEPLDGGLIRGDRKMLYPIREDIPVMLIEEGIPLEGII